MNTSDNIALPNAVEGVMISEVHVTVSAMWKGVWLSKIEPKVTSFLGELACFNISRQTGRLVGSHPTVSLDIRAV